MYAQPIQPISAIVPTSQLPDLHRGGHVKGTQLLTPKGWKDISTITTTDIVIQWNSNGLMEFVSPLLVSSYEVSYTVNLRNHQGHFNQEIAPNHRIIYTRKGEIHETIAQNLNFLQNRTTSHFLNTGELSRKGNGLTVRDRLLIAIQADGYFNAPEKRTGERIGVVPVMFSFAKERKSKRLIELTTEAGLRLDDRKVDKRGRQNWALYIPSNDQVLWPRDKKLASIAELDTVSRRWCSEFVDEASLWDGHIIKENNDRITWRCIDIDNTEYMQAVSSLAGYRTHFSSRADSRSETFSDVHSVQIAKHRNTTGLQSIEVTTKNIRRSVYSIEVPSGYLLIRKDGGVSVAASGY